MKVKLLKTMQGSPDGVSVETYPKGKTCDMPKDLAQVFIDEGWAELLKKKKDDPKPPPGGKGNSAASGAVTTVQKNSGAAPENKGGKDKP